ncbi:ATP-grasp domain-containing protein [Bacillus sp. FJAT-27225]|uniref:ATP-grasp domain-containing protein n=1 Tax=Bacillus sp. FJAT-27225 TaxID=1743144 RepID=UPI0015862F13|nr:ATP-grasp domain-containing protein [Bacillus sp. FJAT-27225]
MFIDSTYFGPSKDAMKAGKKLGYSIHLISNRRSLRDLPDVDHVHIIKELKEDYLILQIDKIRKVYDIKIIISFVDSYVYLAAKLHNVFCIQNISHDVIKIMQNKVLTREFFQSKSYSPYFTIIKKEDPINKVMYKIKQNYPLILKSPSSSGSKDVYLVNNEKQMKNRIHFLRNRNPNEDLIIEEYLMGPQFIVEAIVYEGNTQIVAVIEQTITHNTKFIVTGYSIVSEAEEKIHSSITLFTKHVLNDLGIKNGNCHLELRLVDGVWRIVEINPRMSGGAMNRLLYETYGFDYAEQILKLYRGEQPSIERKYSLCIYAHYITVNSIGKLLSVSGIEQAKNLPGIIEVLITAKEGQVLSPPLSMGHRYGIVIAKGNSCDEAKANAIRASEKITFDMIPIS